MLSGVKFIPPEQVDDDGLNTVSKERNFLDNNRKKKDNSKGKISRNSSDDDDELDKIKKHSRKRTWYSSDENSSTESDRDEKKQMRKGKNIRDDSSSDYSAERLKRKTRARSGKEEYTFEEGFHSSASDGSDCKGRRQKSRGRDGNGKEIIKGEVTDIERREMGLDWILRSESKRPAVSETKEILSEEVPVEEEVFEAHITRYHETQQQSTDRPGQDPIEERRVEYDKVEVSGGKSGDQVLRSGSFDPCFYDYKGGTSYSDSPPSSSGSTARSVCPSAEQSHRSVERA